MPETQRKPQHRKSRRHYLSKSDGALMHRSYADRPMPRTLMSEEQINRLYKGQRYDQQRYT